MSAEMEKISDSEETGAQIHLGSGKNKHFTVSAFTKISDFSTNFISMPPNTNAPTGNTLTNASCYRKVGAFSVNLETF